MTSLVIRNQRKRKPTAMDRSKASKVSKQIRDYVNKTITRKAEHKLFDVTSAGTVTVAPGAMTAIFNDMAKGTSSLQRVGDETYPVSLSGRVLLTADVTATAKCDANVRIIFFQWKMDQQGETAAVADIITLTYLINDHAKQKFHILYDRTVNLPVADVLATSSARCIDIPFFIPQKKFLKTCHYTPGADSTSTNNIQCLLYGNVNGALPQPAYVISCRYTYTDE